MDTNEKQQSLFALIRSKLPAHLSLVDEIAELLNISNDSAYRRIRGEKPIGLDEIQVLCNEYKISLDQILQIQTNTANFSYDKVDHLGQGFNKFLQFIVHNLGLFNTLQNAHMYYYSKDIPLYHFMPFPELRAFKYFFWKRTLIGYPELARKLFDGDDGDPEIIESSNKINELNAKVASTDIWNHESINVTLSQIDLYRQSNIFANNDILLKVYLELEELVNHLEAQAEAGRKLLYNKPEPPIKVSYDAYINEALIGDNTVFVQSDNRQITFINHIGLNFMSTQDHGFCEYTCKNIQNIIRKSTHISVIGEKERYIFFNSFRHKIHDRIRNIK